MATELPPECRSAVEELVKLVYQVLANRARAKRATKYIVAVVKSLQGVALTVQRLGDVIGRFAEMWFDAVSQELIAMRSFAVTMDSVVTLCVEKGARLEDVLVRIDMLIDMLEEVVRKKEAEAIT